MPEYTDALWVMWRDVWGNSFIGALVLLGAFGYLCHKKGYDPKNSFLVIYPVLLGILTSNTYLPLWVGNLFLVFCGLIWGLAILKFIGSRI